MMNKKIFLISFLFILFQFQSQVKDLGEPLSWTTKQTTFQSVPKIVLPNFNLSDQLSSDSSYYSGEMKPFKFGKEYDVDINFFENSKVFNLNEGVLRLIEINSKNAVSINIIFDQFYLEKGSYLYLHNKSYNFYLGAYTSENNNSQNILGTDLIKGDKIIIEFFEPNNNIGKSNLHISKIIHGYKDIDNFFNLGVNESGACNMDVICPDGLPWEKEISSVARIMNGGGLCTGTLINNTFQDGTPYFLTADHCGPANMGSAVFRFNYDSPICGSQTIANSQSPVGAQQTVNGSSLVASNSYSDFGLILLNTVPDSSYDICYSGWNNSPLLPNSAVGIHHPNGDVKKISFDDDPLQTSSSGGTNNMLRIESWERNTTTEGGSSGAGLWDQDHYLVGQLYGGQAACGNSSYDIYGRFSLSWTGNNSTSPNSRLRDWLDPLNSGLTEIATYCPNSTPLLQLDGGLTSTNSNEDYYCSKWIPLEFKLSNSGSSAINSALIFIYIDTVLARQHLWTGLLNPGASIIVNLDTSILVQDPGEHDLDLEIVKLNDSLDLNETNNNLSFRFSNFPETSLLRVSIELDCWGSEVSWNITNDSSGNILYEVPEDTYSDNSSPETVSNNICLSDGCYRFNIFDSYGDGMYGSQYSSCSIDGNYSIINQWDTYTFVTMNIANADYGDSTYNNFCVNNTGINHTKDNIEIKLYPNPSSSNLNIVMSSFISPTNFEILDINGKMVKKFVMNSNKYFLNIDTLSKGFYLLKFHNSSGIKSVMSFIKN